MAGIAGIFPGKHEDEVRGMLGIMEHRGGHRTEIFVSEKGTLGQTEKSKSKKESPIRRSARNSVLVDGRIFNLKELRERHGLSGRTQRRIIAELFSKLGPMFVNEINGSFSIVIQSGKKTFLARDSVGIKPLYYSENGENFMFSSEIKALVPFSQSVKEFPPGTFWCPKSGFKRYFRLRYKIGTSRGNFNSNAKIVFKRLEKSVERRLPGENAGCWLSGGLDSSIIAALVSRNTDDLKTFCVGLEGSPDMEHARVMADHLGTEHREYVLTERVVESVLPDVIYFLESFDAPLVRSSVGNYLASEMASRNVDVAFSGEGADELFGGYAHFLDAESCGELQDGFLDATNALHNNALQRVDRMSSAHGLKVRVPFLDANVIEHSLTLPPEWKVDRNNRVTKRILREAFRGHLPERICKQGKRKFWQGTNITRVLKRIADEKVSDEEFRRNRKIADNFVLNSKEEYYYYKSFKQHFPDISVLGTIGRTKHV